jgi:hypothetical protein
MYQFLNQNLSELNLKDTHSRIIQRRLQINKITDTQHKFYLMLRRIYFHSSISFLLEQIEAQPHFQKNFICLIVVCYSTKHSKRMFTKKPRWHIYHTNCLQR